MAVLSKHLPTDIIVQIIFRLPVKSIVRCTSVCKEWYFLIRNPKFIDKHLGYSASISQRYLLCNPPTVEKHKPKKLLALCDKTFSEVSEWEIPLISNQFCVHGSVNGLICMTDHHRRIHIVNPCIGKCKTIGSWNKGLDGDLFGFGYDPKENDYKVVLIVLFDSGMRWLSNVKVMIYSMRTDLWRVGELAFSWSPSGLRYEGAFLNGFLHWWMRIPGSDEERIMSFDVGLERFQAIRLPKDVRSFNEKFVGNLKGRLAIFEFFPNMSFDTYNNASENCFVWVMNEYGVADSWTRQFHVVVTGGVTRPLCFTDQEEVILKVGEQEILVYDTRTKGLANLDHFDVENFSLVPYMESLLLLDEGAPRLMH